MQEAITPKRFAEILTSVCGADTSADPVSWSACNPLWGHCAVASLLAQDFFGGDLLRISLEGTPFAAVRSHYLNRFPDGQIMDFTGAQFGGYPIPFDAIETRDRSYLFSNAATVARYAQLALRFTRIFADTKLFDDNRYKKCFIQAMKSPCQKLRFGAVLVKDGVDLLTASNEIIGPLASFCDKRCVRLDIPSRTESMIGACGHAEELALWRAVAYGANLSLCDLYVAGFSMQGIPLTKERAEFNCLRCATQMYHARIRKVFVPVNGEWVGLTSTEALESAMQYAIEQKKKESQK